MSQSEDQLIGLLVTKLTGLKENTKEWNKAVSKSKYNLSYYKFTSTSENEVNTSYSNLADKFQIKGHVEFANELLRQKNAFTDSSKWIGSERANQTILKYDLLRLLLSLSNSQNQSFDLTTKRVQGRTQQTDPSWNQVLDEEPLEGDHWKTWSDYSSVTSGGSGDDDDKEGFELDREQLQRKYNHGSKNDTHKTTRQPIDYTEQMELDTRQDNNALEYLISQQYWREHGEEEEMPIDDIENGSILYHPLQLSNALCNRFYSQQERRMLKTLNEADVIREVLFLLKGCESVLFKYDEREDQFILDEKYMVQHLSQQSLFSLLNEFCVYGNMISDLRVIVTRIANRIQYGQTSQAFSTAVVKTLMDFEYQLSNLESENRFTTTDPSKVISLLKLRNVLDPVLQVLKEIHSIAIGIPFDPNNNQITICSYLISVIYECTLLAQSSGQLHIYTHLLDIFEHTMVPFGRMMDDWVFYGNLEMDKVDEFYVKRELEIQKDEKEFWKKGYFLMEVQPSESHFKCPLFDQYVMERVFFTGKAINLLARMKKPPTDLNQSFFSDVISASLSNQNDDPIDMISDDEDGAEDAEQIIIDQEEEEEEVESNMDNVEREELKYDAFTRALFPLLNPSTVKKEDKKLEPSPIGILFDQVFSQAVERYIEKPYHQVANYLNNVLHQECALDQQLKTLASVYLMLENDLMHSFCESLFTQMDKQSNWFDEIIINQIYLEASELSGYKDIVYIHIDHSTKAKDLTSCLGLIRFNVQIKWPLNNFIQSSNLSEYTKITSFLIRLKRAKYVLEKCTMVFGRERNSRGPNTKRFYTIRIKMLWFVNAFWGYMMTTILHAETLKFYNNLSKSKDADEITALHNDYVRCIVDYCLLNNKSVSIKKTIIQIMDLTEKMGELFKRFMVAKEDDDTLLNNELDGIEKEFDSANKFIATSLNILGRKTNFPWFESLASSLSAQ